MKIEFTEEQVRNMAAFLQRVQLQGKEVPAYNALINKLVKALEDEKPKKDKKE